ncbi:hypothetical protein BH18CHL2_BH18CHL2_12790 [soil metagenome]
MSRLAPRLALAILAVAALSCGLIAAGSFFFGQRAFEELMVQHGESVANARSMFEQTVTIWFVAAATTSAIASTVAAALLAWSLAAPLDRLGEAARDIARGELGQRVAREGPEEVVSLADSFNQMADQLQEHERLRRDFVVNAAHELRTPLTNLRGYLEALRDGVIAPGRETFESLQEEVERLVRLSRSLDLLAEGDLAQHAPELSELDVAAAIASAIELAQPTLERRRIAWDVQIPQGLRARANADHLAQVLANLLQNAMRYTPEGGRVVIAAQTQPNDVLVSLTNSGDGIPATDLPHVFERFYRVEKSRDRARGGAGIGLAIVKQLVELGGGKFGAESAAGMTRFWFSLPT